MEKIIQIGKMQKQIRMQRCGICRQKLPLTSEFFMCLGYGWSNGCHICTTKPQKIKRNSTIESCTYLVSDGTAYKIGFINSRKSKVLRRAEAVDNRIMELQIGNPRRIILVCLLQGSHWESKLHKEFADFRLQLGVKTEWFSLNSAIKERFLALGASDMENMPDWKKERLNLIEQRAKNGLTKIESGAIVVES